MMDITNDLLESPKMVKQAFLNAFDNHTTDEFNKEASELTGSITRRRLREDAFSPYLLPYEKVEDSDLAYHKGEDLYVICEMEADQAMPVGVSFNDSARLEPYYGDKYEVTFSKNTTPTWIKNVDFLRTYRADIRTILSDNALRDLSRLKDGRFIATTDAITGIIPGAPSPLTNEQQYIQLPGRLDRDNWVSSLNYLPSRDLQNGTFLMNRITAHEFLRWNREEFGGDKAQTFIEKGLTALESSELTGVKLLITNKSDLVPNGTVYQFAPPNYLGKAFVLQKPTMYVKKDKDMLEFSCSEKLGLTIANANAVQRVCFTDVVGPYAGDGRITVLQA